MEHTPDGDWQRLATPYPHACATTAGHSPSGPCSVSCCMSANVPSYLSLTWGKDDHTASNSNGQQLQRTVGAPGHAVHGGVQVPAAQAAPGPHLPQAQRAIVRA